jgi:Leucine-rich repeat (LRR) protein
MYEQLNLIDKHAVKNQRINSDQRNTTSRLETNIKIISKVFGKTKQIIKILLFLFFIISKPTKCNSYVYNNSVVNNGINKNSITLLNNIPLIEIKALQDLYNSTNGDKWIWDYPYNNITGFPWNFTAVIENNENPCLKPWQGIYCGNEPNISQLHILKIHLIYMNLSGSIPDSLDNLVKLKVLDFAANYLTGTIPNSLSNLKDLQILNFVYNKLIGTIPESLGNLLGLKILYLSFNGLTGTIPNSLGNLSELKIMSLFFNDLYGTIPDSFYKLSQLIILDLSYNNLDGKISNLLGDLTKLEVLYFNNNKLTGEIPSSIEKISDLKILVLNTNILSGNLDNISNILNLEILSIYENELSGNLSNLFINMVNLEFLSICNNLFTGVIPNSIGNLNNLFISDFSYNYFTGLIPNTLSNLNKLESFSIYSNYISGSITTDISKMVSLKIFIVNENKLTGNLNLFINQSSLTTLLVQDNQLTGILPESLFQIESLQTFVANSNCFSGTLPMSICDAKNIVSIVLNGMSSSKSCRQKILPFTPSFILDNSVKGNIPSCLYQLPNIITLQLAGNKFNGKISTGENITSTLLNLDLAHNLLSGTIPKIIQEKKWNNLDLSFNRLSGSLIDSFNGNTQILSLQNNHLSGKIPRTIKNFKDIIILSGNLFSCNLDKSDLPQNDDGINNYECGSNSFNIIYYLWLGLSLISIIVIYRSFRIYNLNLGSFGCILNNLTLISKHCVLVITFILLPFYIISSIFYSTYTDQYAWMTSAAFLSGIVPFVIEFILFILLLSILFVSIHNKVEEDNKQVLQSDDLQVYIIYVVLNIIMVISVNILYLYILIYQGSELQIFAQIILSFFKVFWGKVCTPALLKFIAIKIKPNQSFSEIDYSSLQIFISLFNNIVIPCFVVLIINPSCFYNVFVNSPEIISNYEYQICIINISTGNCDSYIQSYNTTTFTSPFTYDYQCSSSIITHYIPPFLIMCIINTFAIPITNIILQKVYLRSNSNSILFYFSNMIIPKIMKNVVSDDNLIECDQVIIMIITYLGLILTFGTVFPLLAISLFINILSIIYFTKYNIENFINSIEENNREKIRDKILKECTIVGNLPIIISSMWMIIAFSLCFYSLFLFDTLGSVVGFEMSYWVIIVVPLIYLPLYLSKSFFLGSENLNKEIELEVLNVIV